MAGNPLDSVKSFFESGDAELDKVKESTHNKLSSLQEQVEGETANNTIKELKEKALEGLKVDLEEIGVTDKKLIAQYQSAFETAWGQKQAEILEDGILESAEAKALVDFATDPKHLGKLGERIKDLKNSPTKMMLINLANSMGMGWLVGFIEPFLEQFSSKKKEDKEKEGEETVEEEAPEVAAVNSEIFEGKSAMSLINWPKQDEREAAFDYLNEKLGGGLTEMTAGENGMMGEKPARIVVDGRTYELSPNPEGGSGEEYVLRDLEIDKQASFDGRIQGPDDGDPPSLKYLVHYHKERDINNA